MTALYLTGIELSEFRSFAHLQVALAPEPGVLLVHGSNGLGKSSLFDALEWTLTGDIDHFRSADGYKKFGNYLCRWGEGIGPTSSALRFSDGKRIQRELASEKATSPILKGDVPNITEYLRVPAWSPSISALNRYLLLTHFLGQSTLSRLTHRDPDERFAILKEASQSADLERFGIALHGAGTTQPARAFAKRVAELERDAADLRILLEQEAETWSAAQAAGALNDTEASSLSREIITKLSKAWTHITGRPAPFAPTDPVNAIVLQSAIDQTEAEVRTRDFAVAEARRMLALRQRHEATLAQAAASAKEAERELASASKAAEEAQQATTAHRTTLAAALTPLTAARDVYAHHIELAKADTALQAATAERERAAAALIAARAAFAQAEQAMQRNERHAQIVARLRSEVDDLFKSLLSTRDQIDQGRQWLARLAEIEANRAEFSDLQSANPELKASLAAARQKVEVAQATVQAQSEALQNVRRLVGELSAAVSTIAAHLPIGAHECPACAAHYASPAELQERIDAVAERLAPMVVTQQAALRAAEEKLTDATAALAVYQGVFDRISLLTVQIRANLETNRQLLAGLGWDPDCNFAGMQEKLADLERTAKLLEARRARRLRWIDRIGFDGAAGSAAATAIRRRDDARRAEDAATRHFGDATATERLAKDAFSAHAERLFSGQSSPTRSQIDAAIQTATAVLALAQQDYDFASTALAEQLLRLAPLQEAEAGQKARINQAVSERDRTRQAMTDFAAQWRAAGWTDADMTDTKIENAAIELSRGRESLSEAATSLKRLRDGREAWGRQQSHRTAFERLVAEVDVAPNSTREQIRALVEHKLVLVEANAHATALSKEVASKASTAIATAVSEFNAEYIEPLDRLTKSINQAILCDPRIGIDLHLNKKSIKQSATRNGELPPKRKIDPMLVHSEGQMAALAVSMLCAASLTYPWSRWRALILDDPLQHNDAIHAAAFADMMANLVQAKKYQILLSTHDLGQADFLRRKFEARKIPCAVLNLLGRGKAGVETEFVPSDIVSRPASASA